MDLQKAIDGRRSIRVFKKEPVSDGQIRELIKAGTKAPSACNRQQWHFIAIRSRKTKEKIYKKCGSQKLILDAPVCIAVCYDTELNKEHHANIQSVAAAVQNINLKAHEMGLGTTWIAGFGDQDKAAEILNLPDNLRVMCFMILGKPAQSPPPTKRKPLEEVLSFEAYKGDAESLPKTIRSSAWTLDQIRKNQKLIYRSTDMSKDREIWAQEDKDLIRRVLKKELGPNKKGRKLKVLDAFSYDGTILRDILGLFKNHDIFTCELTSEAAEIVTHKFNNIKCLVYKDRIPLKDRSIDLAFMAFSLEKIPKKEKIIKDIRRVLRPGGKLIIFFKNKASPYGLAYSAWEMMGVDMSNNFISPDPFEPISSFKIRGLLKGFDAEIKPGYFMMPEIRTFKEKFSGFGKRFGKGIKMKKLASAALSIGSFFFRATKALRIPYFSSTMYSVAEKKGQKNKH